MKKINLILCFLMFFSSIIWAQQVEEVRRNLHKNWRIGGNTGMSYLAFELKKNFQQATMDMNSIPNPAFSFFVTKRFTKNIEAGIEYEKCYFSGYKNYSSNVNWLVYDQSFNNETSHFLKTPIYYNTNISSWYLNFYYDFLNLYTLKRNFLNINFFLKGGFGFSYIGVEMGYKDPLDYEKSNLPDPLYEKGQGRQPRRDSYSTFHVGAGMNYYLSNRISFSLEGIFLFVNADYLDGVHNFEVTNLPGGTTTITRIGVYDTVGQIKAGVSYHFSLYPERRRKSNKWSTNKIPYVNDFFFDKKHNRVLKVTNPYSNEEFMKTERHYKRKIIR
jgi:hypothetical protein